MQDLITAIQMQSYKIKIYEPFARFLEADLDEYEFTLSLLDIVRFAGHACPAMVGAFLIAQRATKELFPETNTCIRGQIAIDIPTAMTQGATGPISNVFSMIFGSWSDSGFAGLQGKFARRGLLRYNVASVLPGAFRFTHLETGASVDISYNPSPAGGTQNVDQLSFQNIWRLRITEIIKNADKYLSVNHIHSR